MELLTAHQPMTAGRLLDAVAETAGWEKTNDQDRMEQRVNRCVRCCMNLIVHCEDNTIQFTHIIVRRLLQIQSISHQIKCTVLIILASQQGARGRVEVCGIVKIGWVMQSVMWYTTQSR